MAKMYVQNQDTDACHAIPSTSTRDEIAPPALKKFKFLSSRMERHECLQIAQPDGTIAVELDNYLKDIKQQGAVCNALEFWDIRKTIYPKLSPLAEDLVSAPASQAYVERIFSVAGILSTGRRNRMRQSLEMRVFLKMNSQIIGW